MKNMTKICLLALGLSAGSLFAQDSQPPADGRPPGGPGGHRPPPPLIIAALDANHDGVIDADEIANASAALKALDKNGDGQLTPDEFIGPRPPGGPGGCPPGPPPGGPDGAGAQPPPPPNQ